MDVGRANRMLKKATELLSTLTSRTLRRGDQQYIILRHDGLPGVAAALSVRAGDDISETLCILELSRGVISRLYYEKRTDITQLQIEHPVIAETFVRLCNELDT